MLFFSVSRLDLISDTIQHKYLRLQGSAVYHKSGKPIPPIFFKAHHDLFLFPASFQFHMDLEICLPIHLSLDDSC